MKADSTARTETEKPERRKAGEGGETRGKRGGRESKTGREREDGRRESRQEEREKEERIPGTLCPKLARPLLPPVERHAPSQALLPGRARRALLLGLVEVLAGLAGAGEVARHLLEGGGQGDAPPADRRRLPEVVQRHRGGGVLAVALGEADTVVVAGAGALVGYSKGMPQTGVSKGEKDTQRRRRRRRRRRRW